jgi:hypothetical protein
MQCNIISPSIISYSLFTVHCLLSFSRILFVFPSSEFAENKISNLSHMYNVCMIVAEVCSAYLHSGLEICDESGDLGQR